MPDAVFKVYVNNKPVGGELLDRIEEVVVDQEVDMATEARIKILLTIDDQGRWSDEDAEFLVPFTRTRVEVMISDGQSAALVDGPVVSSDYNLTSEPGKSSVTIIVHDDSAFLNREEKIVRFDNMADHEIAQQIFSGASQITSYDIDTTPKPDVNFSSVVQRGTDMELLRELARRHCMHAYVLPGSSPGQSIGCFKAFSVQPTDLPALTMLGENRTLMNFFVRQDGRLPSKVSAFTLDLASKLIGESNAVYSDAEKLGDEETMPEPADMSVHILSPYADFSTSVDSAVIGRAILSGFAFEAKGSPNAYYTGILQPYKTVDVLGVNARLSGRYLISSVTHKLNRSSYTQQFVALRNARSGGSGYNSAGAGRIF